MKSLGIILMGATVFVAGCACDCDDKLGNSALGTDTTGHVMVLPPSNGDGDYTSSSGTESGSNTTDRGNTPTDNNGNGNATTPSTTEADKGTKPQKDPRQYNQTSGGVGYRTDTLNEYDGIDGSARDKGPIDDVPNPK